MRISVLIILSLCACSEERFESVDSGLSEDMNTVTIDRGPAVNPALDASGTDGSSQTDGGVDLDTGSGQDAATNVDAMPTADSAATENPDGQPEDSDGADVGSDEADAQRDDAG